MKVLRVIFWTWKVCTWYTHVDVIVPLMLDESPHDENFGKSDGFQMTWYCMMCIPL